MKPTKLLIAVVICGMFAGCKVGPNYSRPLVQTPTTYRDLQGNPQLQTQAASYADLPWWQVFQDPKLQELIRTALKQNYDCKLQQSASTPLDLSLRSPAPTSFLKSKAAAISPAGKTPILRASSTS